MLYTTLKFVHILAAAVWFGGAVTVSVLAAGAPRAEPSASVVMREQTGRLGARLFGPAAGLTLLAGIATAVAGDVDMSRLWIVWGYAAVLATAFVGGSGLRRTGVRLSAALDRGDSAGGAVLARRMGRLGALNLLILASTIWAMVAKPTL